MDIQYCYQLLGVSRNSTQKQINTAYKRWAMILHPDKQTAISYSLDDINFIKIRQAYQFILNQRKRQTTFNLAKQIVRQKFTSIFSQSDQDGLEEDQRHFNEQQKRMNEKLSSISSTLNRWNYKPELYKTADNTPPQNPINSNKTQTMTVTTTISYEAISIKAQDLDKRIKNKINIFNIVYEEYS